MDRSRSSDHPTRQHGAAHDDFFARERDWTPQLEGRSHMRDLQRSRGGSGVNGASWLNTVVGQRALQMRSAADRHAAHADTARTHDHAARGVAGAGQPLPFLDRIQASFGAYDVSGVRAQVGGAAREASDAIGAQAYATDGRVAFRDTPDLHTAAHEAAHVVQQRHGVHLKGGVGAEGDAYERHADAVADAVVAGRDAAPVLAQMAPAPAQHASADSAVQCKQAVQMSGGGAGATPTQNLNDRGVPKLMFKGADLAGVQATRKFPLANAKKEYTLVDRGWDIPIPGIPPVLHATVKLEAKAAASADLSASVGYTWDATKGVHKIDAKLTFEGKLSLSGGVLAGLELDAVFAEMGFGLYGGLVNDWTIKAEKAASFEVQPNTDTESQELEWNPALVATPLDVSIGGMLGANLKARAWAESFWGGESKYEWTFADCKFAELKGLRAKADLAINGDGITPSFGAVEDETMEVVWHLPTMDRDAASTRIRVQRVTAELQRGVEDQYRTLQQAGYPTNDALWIDALVYAMDPQNARARARGDFEMLHGRTAPCSVGSLSPQEWRAMYTPDIVRTILSRIIYDTANPSAAWDTMQRRLNALGRSDMIEPWLGERPIAPVIPSTPPPRLTPAQCAMTHGGCEPEPAPFGMLRPRGGGLGY